MNILDRYIIKKFLSTFFFAIMILAIIACVIDYSEKVDAFVSKNVPALEILNYFKNFVPHIVALLFPLFIFIATIFFTSKMAYKSEIIAILAAGISFQRFLRPFIIGGGFLALLSLVANHWIVPEANKKRLAFENKYINYHETNSKNDIHLRLRPNLYVYIRDYDYPTNAGTKFTSEIIDGTELREKIMAERMSYDSLNDVWKLYDVTIRTNDGIKETLTYKSEMEKKYPFSLKDLKVRETIKESLPTPELNAYIAQEKLRGRETLYFLNIEKHRRTAQPFAAFILTLIGACIASKRIRGGSGLHLAIGIVISCAYILAMKFTDTLSINAGLDPLIAVWIPNILFSGVAGYLLYREIK